MRRFICIASGPSLTPTDVEATRGQGEVIVVNDNWRLAPWAQHLYACDAKWWDHHGEAVLAGFRGHRWTQQSIEKPSSDQKAAIERWRLMSVGGKWEDGLGIDCIHYGENSGYQAINLAYLLGAEQILLLGYDMQRTSGREHWFGDHPQALKTGPDYDVWIGHFDVLAKDLKREGVDVINCTRETALTCFPRQSLSEALCESRTANCAS